MKTTNRIYANNSSSSLAADITASSVQVSLESASSFPDVPSGKFYFMTLATETDVEIVKVVSSSGNTLTVVRAQEGTTAKPFLAGTSAELRFTASSLYDVRDDLTFLSKDMFEG